MEYRIKILPTNDMVVKLWCNKNAVSEDVLIFDGWTLNGTLNYGMGIDGMVVATSPVNGGRTPDDQYDPNITKPDTPMSADDFLPMFVYAIIHAAPTDLMLTKEMVVHLIDPEEAIAERGYYVASLQAAVQHVLSLKWSATSKSDKMR